MDTAKYIGRVGALAVALGVGAVGANTPGIAWADEPDTSSTSTASSEDSTPTTPSTESTGGPAKTTMASGGFSTSNRDSATTTTTFDTATTRSTTTIGAEANPKVVIRNSGGAHTAGTDDDLDPDTAEFTAVTLETDNTTTLMSEPAAITNVSSPLPAPGHALSAATRNAETPTRGTAPTTADDASKRVADNAGPPTEKADTVTVPMGDAAQASLSNIAAEDDGGEPQTSLRATFMAAPQASPSEAEASKLAPEQTAPPGTFIGVETSLLTAGLTPLVAPEPAIPTDSPVLWSVLAWTRSRFAQMISVAKTTPIAATPVSLTSSTPPVVAEVGSKIIVRNWAELDTALGAATREAQSTCVPVNTLRRMRSSSGGCRLEGAGRCSPVEMGCNRLLAGNADDPARTAAVQGDFITMLDGSTMRNIQIIDTEQARPLSNVVAIVSQHQFDSIECEIIACEIQNYGVSGVGPNGPTGRAVLIVNRTLQARHRRDARRVLIGRRITRSLIRSFNNGSGVFASTSQRIRTSRSNSVITTSVAASMPLAA